MELHQAMPFPINFLFDAIESESRSLGIFVFDYESGDVLEIDRRNRSVTRSKIDAEYRKNIANPIEAFTQLSADDGEFIRDEKLNGKQTRVFQLKKLSGFFGPPLTISGSGVRNLADVAA